MGNTWYMWEMFNLRIERGCVCGRRSRRGTRHSSRPRTTRRSRASTPTTSRRTPATGRGPFEIVCQWSLIRGIVKLSSGNRHTADLGPRHLQHQEDPPLQVFYPKNVLPLPAEKLPVVNFTDKLMQGESSVLSTSWSASTLLSWWLGGPASRHGSLNFLLQVASYLPSKKTHSNQRCPSKSCTETPPGTLQ